MTSQKPRYSFTNWSSTSFAGSESKRRKHTKWDFCVVVYLDDMGTRITPLFML